MTAMRRPEDLDHKKCSEDELAAELDELARLLGYLWPVYEHYYEVIDERGTRVVSSKVKSPFLYWLLNRFQKYLGRILNQAQLRSELYSEELQRRTKARR